MKFGWKNFVVMMAMFQAASCSQFMSRRDYLTEMENDDSNFWNPNQDFPVVAGDNGDFSLDHEQRKARTPASAHDVYQDQYTRSLEAELAELESKQAENSLYQKYHHKIGTTSERIYFLKLPAHERRDYLEARGIAEAEPLYTNREKDLAIQQSDILLGMTKDEVVNSWGAPLKVEVAGNPSYENERWFYRPNGASKYIYFESGKVEGWE
jgi:hypothetical protein